MIPPIALMHKILVFLYGLLLALQNNKLIYFVLMMVSVPGRNGVASK